MTDDFLSRWSRRKIAARKGPVPATAQPTPEAARNAPAAGAVPEPSGTQSGAPAVPDLPPIDSLTLDSDFTPFMQPNVDPALRRAALKKLVRDPRFNVMDGLDVYIDDYSKADPLPEGWLEKMNQVKHLGHYLEPEEGEEAPLQKTIEQQADEADSSLPAPPAEEERSRDSE